MVSLSPTCKKQVLRLINQLILIDDAKILLFILTCKLFNFFLYYFNSYLLFRQRFHIRLTLNTTYIPYYIHKKSSLVSRPRMTSVSVTCLIRLDITSKHF